MKNSGIEWIGQIPDSWRTIRFKFLHNGMNTGEAIDKEYWTNDVDDTLFYTAGIRPIRTNYSEFPTWKYTKESDLLLARNGIPYVYNPTANACYTDHIIRADMIKGVNKRYIKYGLQQSINRVVVDSVSITTWSASLWNEQVIPYPPIDEQQIISTFMDNQCFLIDSIIEKTQKSIEEYKKLKEAIITQAVTKGVRGDRPMKDSGIEWIGKIPKEWEVTRIKNIFSLRDERNSLPLEEVNLISLYTDKGVLQHSDIEKTTGNKASNADGYKLVYENDIVVNIILCWMGAIGRSAYNGVTSPAYDIYVPSDIIECEYYHHYFRTSGFSGDCFKRGRGIMLMRWRTYSDQFRDIHVACPPIEEQREILAYLNLKCTEIDALITKKEQLITELENYKKSMIYEYVTGKKEVTR
jgi:type I restriction enzyme S subunit